MPSHFPVSFLTTFNLVPYVRTMARDARLFMGISVIDAYQSTRADLLSEMKFDPLAIFPSFRVPSLEIEKRTYPTYTCPPTFSLLPSFLPSLQPRRSSFSVSAAIDTARQVSRLPPTLPLSVLAFPPQFERHEDITEALRRSSDRSSVSPG